MLPSRPFYLIRHGQSEANAARITAGGQLDSPLTPKGRAQAEYLRKFLDQMEVTPDIIYHSTMIRARDTAALLNETLKLKMVERHDLREHDLGVWEGEPWVDIEPLLDRGDIPAGGESVAQFSQRIQLTLTEILQNGHKMPVVVAHGGLFHAMGFLYEYAMAEVQNCHLHMFEPYPTYDTFPWRVWQFDVTGGKLLKSPAPFCISHTMSQIG